MVEIDLFCCICGELVYKKAYFNTDKEARQAGKILYYCNDHKPDKKYLKIQYTRTHCAHCERRLADEKYRTQAQMRKISKQIKYCSICTNKYGLGKKIDDISTVSEVLEGI